MTSNTILPSCQSCFIFTYWKAMAPHSSTLAWKIPWTEEPGRLQSWGHWGLDTTERLHFHFSLSCIGEGNGNPLQCSCLENPRDGGAWWAAVYGVTQSRTRLKWLSSSSSSKKTYTKKVSLRLMSKFYCLCFSRNFMAFGLTFQSLIHFELLLVHNIRK